MTDSAIIPSPECIKLKQTTAEPATPEQVASEHATPEQVSAEHVTPGQTSAELTTPKQDSPEHATTGQGSPEHSALGLLSPEHADERRLNISAEPALRGGQCLPGTAAPFRGDCRWLISLDYDGTLRSGTGAPISEDFLKLMDEWRGLGVRWGINTGRALPYLLQELLPSTPILPDFICTCERYAYLDRGDGILVPAARHNEISSRANLALREQLSIPFRRELDRISSTHPGLLWDLDPHDPLSIVTPDVATMDSIMEQLSPLLQSLSGVAAQRAGRYMRLSDARFNKGTALAHIANTWQVPASRLVILGDGHNDIDAFSRFPQAFCGAPRDAHPEVLAYLRQSGGYISRTPGVIEGLRYWRHRFLR